MRNSDPISQPNNNELPPEPSPKLTRQEIYDRVRQSSKEEYILSEMTRLGFWQKDRSKPSIAEQFIEKRTSLLTKLRELTRLDQLYRDPEKALLALHKERKQSALDKREQTRINHNLARYEKALNWHNKQKKSFSYLGDAGAGDKALTAALQHKSCDKERLIRQGLPAFESIKQLAEAMGISVAELRFLCYQKDVSRVSHYQHFALSKKTGGTRLISAPMPRMKRAQYWLLDNILNVLPIHNAAHGFIAGRSIVSNAKPHTNKQVVINLDLKDFFPTVSYPRVKGLFKQAGYSEELAVTFALLATKPDTQAVEMDGQVWHITGSERVLPQGSPCSPAITNVLCRRLDARLQGMAHKLGFCYTRYADDLTFSSDDTDKIQSLLWRCQHIVTDEGFILHPDKTRVMRKHQKQAVTGIVVNDGLSVDRPTLKRFRATVRQVELDGPEGKHWGTGELFQCLTGYANFVAMVAPEKGIPLQKQVAHLKRQYNIPVAKGKISELNKRLFRIKAAKGEVPRDSWWQPAEKPVPVLALTQKQINDQKQADKQQAAPRQEADTPPMQRDIGWDTIEQNDAQPPSRNVTNNQIVWITIIVLICIKVFFY
ncbi:reverse transcriptase family protein [Photobacterium nomapromontoriensis]|uniref:reverse transcriptase family protein n=1 Tax=Photobacterium nomapromontoriensis TaxID=2910237 RepID=UPI003D0BB3CD